MNEKEIEEKIVHAFFEYLRPLFRIDPEFLKGIVKAREIQKKLANAPTGNDTRE